MKSRRVRAELFHADGRAGGRTDRHDEAKSLFVILRTPLKYTHGTRNLVGVYAVLCLRDNTFMRDGVGELCRKVAARITANFDDNIKRF